MSKYEMNGDVFNQLIQQCYGTNIQIEWREDHNKNRLNKIWLSGFENETGHLIKEVFFDSDWEDSPMMQFINPLLDHIGMDIDELKSIYREAEVKHRGLIEEGVVKFTRH
ncbi:MAG: hypothetical protein HN790_05675 [Methylococcales bacterium]|jgi:hypothetical protein|nr:hypothetical protein [Methylococcales bacterium]